MERLSEKVIEADETIPELPVKDIVSKLLLLMETEPATNMARYFAFIEVHKMHLQLHSRWMFDRSLDIRFSKDPTPYKVGYTTL